MWAFPTNRGRVMSDIERGKKGRPLLPAFHKAPQGQVHDHKLDPKRVVIISRLGNPARPDMQFELCALGPPPVGLCIQSWQTENFWIIGFDTLVRMAIREGIEREPEDRKVKLIVPGGLDIT